MNVNALTINSEINELLQQLLLKTQSILMSKLVGMYVGGSIANDSFDHDKSDIDCYIITKNKLPKNIVHKIEVMHKQFYICKHSYAKKIESSYIPQNDLVNFDPNGMRPYFNEGCFHLAPYGSNFKIELFILREKGIRILGPDIKQLIKKISTQELKLAIKKNLYEYWEPALKDTKKFKRSDYQVFAILTMCRTLYSLETGSIASKMEAARWSISKLETKWTHLIEKSITWKPGYELEELEDTLQFIRYILNLSHNENP